MKTIFKYQLKLKSDQQVIQLPEDYRIITIQNQDNVPTIWCEVNPENKHKDVCIAMYGTGHAIRNINQVYIGTVQMANGLVWHFYLVR